jgi:histidinol-phosphate aminotransferase
MSGNMKTANRFAVSPNIEQIQPYVPGKPEEELVRELGLTQVIKLASNENALGPSPRAAEAMTAAVSKTNRYPDSGGYYLREALAERLKVPFSSLVLGNGSTDLIELIARTYLEPRHNTIIADQTFLMYRIATLSMNATCITVPLKDHLFDLDAILDNVNKETRIVFIANPNNPTGTMLRKNEMNRFIKSLRSDVFVVLDEAYIDFVTDSDFADGIQYLKKFPNVIVLRTFSKIHGLAGIRIGYGIAAEEIVENLNRLRAPFNTNVLAQAAALAALQDQDHIEKSRLHVLTERKLLETKLTEMKLAFVPSVTNFIYLPLPNATGLYEKLLQEGIIVRPMKSFNHQEGLRVTIGTHEENVAFLQALQKTLA